ncbi:uncharacterized protein LOC118736874 [Rhagoletis pomonella]|uniref:uncharacterized protein LOC118736874 n=1 Tax=Rhagoletis pomonella TaxID=28610 RepID=UPI00177F1BF2|nr:uncharacterized protein LOC118736874 [Rhagoletis pomonella]
MKYYTYIYAITAFSQIYLCDVVLGRTLRSERSVTADGALKPLRLSRLSPSNYDGKRARLTNPKESSSHILKGVVSGRLVQPQTNVQRYQLYQQRQRRQQQQPQQPQTLQKIIGIKTRIPRYDQQIIQAEQLQLRHQHKPNRQLSGQNNNAHFENHRNYEEHGKRNPDLNGRHVQIESMHNYDIIYKVSKENSSIRNFANNSGGDDISLPRDNPEPAITDAKKLTTTFTKEAATTKPANIAMKLVALTDSQQSAIQVTPTLVKQLANMSILSTWSASFHHLPALQKTRLEDASSEVDANHVTPIAFDRTFRNRRSIPENPFLLNYMGQNHFNEQKTSSNTNAYAQSPSPHFPSHVQNSTEKSHFNQNPFLQKHIPSTTRTTTSTTTQRTLMPETTHRAPTLNPDLRQLIKNGAIIFPDSQYLTPTLAPSREQQTIDIRRR